MKKPLLLIAALVFAFGLVEMVTTPAGAQPEKPLTEETPAPPQPTDPAVTAPIPVVQPGGFGNWFSRGGNTMWLILACALVAVVFILERAFTLAKARSNSRALMTDVLNAVRRDGIAGGERVCEQTKGPIAAIIHSGLRQARRGPEAVEKAIEAAGAVEMSFLERGLVWLATVSTVAPLLGFLGTVLGVMHSLDGLAAADTVSAKLVAGGISEALIPTQFGLLVAIPVAIAHNLFLSLVDRFVVEMQESSSELVGAVADLR
jgi:biopolymer transport protein ExbB